MLSFIAQRLIQSVLVMLTVALIAFAMFRYVGDPIASMVGQDTTPEQRAQLREQLGLRASAAVRQRYALANVLAHWDELFDAVREGR